MAGSQSFLGRRSVVVGLLVFPEEEIWRIAWAISGDRLSNLGELGVLGAKPFWAGEENRAKGAKVKGKKDDEIAGVVVEGGFALDNELDDQGIGQ